MILASESGLAGSAGSVHSTARVSTAKISHIIINFQVFMVSFFQTMDLPMTPTGMPPKRALPVTTVRAHPDIISSNDPLSKNPDS